MEENTNLYVIDASYVLNYLLPDEQSQKVMKVFKNHKERLIDFVSTELLFFEVANSLHYAVRKNRIGMDFAKKLLVQFENLEIEIIKVDIHLALEIASIHDISVYDASYIALSRSEHLPCLTLDKKLQKLTD